MDLRHAVQNVVNRLVSTIPSTQSVSRCHWCVYSDRFKISKACKIGFDQFTSEYTIGYIDRYIESHGAEEVHLI